MQTDAVRCAYMHTKIEEAIRENENVLKELRQLGRLSSLRDELHGFTTDKINSKHVIIAGNFNADLQSPQRADTWTLIRLVNAHAPAFVSRNTTHHLFYIGHESHTPH